MKLSSNMVYRSMMWIAIVLILFTCHQAISPYVKSSVESRTTAGSVDIATNGKPLHIDSVVFRPGNFFFPTKDAATQKLHQKIKSFYQINSFKTKWLTEKGPSPLYYALASRLSKAAADGLTPSDYDLADVDFRIRLSYFSKPLLDARELAELDILLTEKFFRFTTHLSEGKVKRTGYDKSVWQRQVVVNNYMDLMLLSSVSSPFGLQRTFDKLEPTHPQYRKLKSALQFYRTLPEVEIPPVNFKNEEEIEPGCTHTIIPSIRKKLMLTEVSLVPDMLDVPLVTDSTLYDSALLALVKNFQQRHGVVADGIIGDKTLRLLRQPFRDKIATLIVNMERLRWTPRSYGDEFILVNIPDYKLNVVDSGQNVLEMKVVVGNPDFPTPVFNDELEYLVFSPTWTVPPRIMQEEIIPKLIEDPLYYAEKNYTFYKNDIEIDPLSESWDAAVLNPRQYRVVQHPGADNSLGRIKFIMPNTMNVYLHDTPSRRLFRKNYRAFSHGCVRLEQPRALAEYLLAKQHWDAEALDKAMESAEPLTIMLKNKTRVYLEYHTAWVDERGAVQFRDDIYGHDRHQLSQLIGKKRASAVAGI